MSKVYAIEPDPRRRLAVRILVDEFIFDQDGSPNLDYHIDEMIKWCRDNHCGYRIAYDMFAFKSQKELSMFLLKWQ